MPVRFTVTSPDNDDRRVLSDASAPCVSDYYRCGLIQALISALAYCGTAVDYSSLMGLTALAFAVKQPNSFAHQPVMAVPPDYIKAALRALGYEAHVQTPEDMLAPERALPTVEKEIKAGRPVVAYGWGSPPPAWALITGYDRSRTVLHGYLVAAAPQPMLEAAPQADLLICLGDAGESLLAAAAAQQAIARGADLWCHPPPDTGSAAYSNLLSLLENAATFAADFPEVAVSAHESLIACLIDARGAAGQFLEAHGELCPAIPAAWLQRAADLYGQLTDLLEARTPPVFDPLAQEVLKDSDWRREWIERLREVAELDMQAAGCLRRSFSADFPPAVEEE